MVLGSQNVRQAMLQRNGYLESREFRWSCARLGIALQARGGAAGRQTGPSSGVLRFSACLITGPIIARPLDRIKNITGAAKSERGVLTSWMRAALVYGDSLPLLGQVLSCLPFSHAQPLLSAHRK